MESSSPPVSCFGVLHGSLVLRVAEQELECVIAFTNEKNLENVFFRDMKKNMGLRIGEVDLCAWEKFMWCAQTKQILMMGMTNRMAYLEAIYHLAGTLMNRLQRKMAVKIATELRLMDENESLRNSLAVKMYKMGFAVMEEEKRNRLVMVEDYVGGEYPRTGEIMSLNFEVLGIIGKMAEWNDMGMFAMTGKRFLAAFKAELRAMCWQAPENEDEIKAQMQEELQQMADNEFTLFGKQYCAWCEQPMQGRRCCEGP